MSRVLALPGDLLMIKGMNHVGISVSNLDRALAFYRDVLGMHVIVDRAFSGEMYDAILGLKKSHGRVAALSFGSLQVELFEFVSPQPRRGDPQRPVCDHGITHFCLEVTEIEREYERLKAAGVPFHCPPQNSGKAIATYGRDPDGNVFELLEIL